MRVLYVQSGVDNDLITPIGDDASDLWRVSAGVQSFANAIPSPSGWQADELPASVIDNADWNNGVVGLLPAINTTYRLAAPAWGFPQDEPPSALKDDDYMENGIALKRSLPSAPFRLISPWIVVRDEGIYASGSTPPSPATGGWLIIDRRRRR